ncbi:peptide chain release factor 2 [Candidatus Peregrinibacteria bacterium CG10_big_fil_rev_8_21_14_0_10_36_19]|nr:MAG: peptide chain release factor 2 [Candidatus Peregrinibacteria bacterium CG10_big_fil_rev_8_21_14_0_10_36_19]
MHEIKTQLEELKKLINQGVEKIDLPSKIEQVELLEKEMQSEGFWDDSTHAAEVSTKAAGLKKLIEIWQGIKEEVEELLALHSVIPEDEGSEQKEYREMVANLLERWKKLEISTFLSGKYDTNSAILSIHAGTGGTDAQDFAEMLLRMYLRYAERMGYETVLIDKSVGEEAGIKSCTVMINGDFAFGYLKGENGVHRLVRMSPFNSKGTRETSFAMVEILPHIERNQEVEIKDEDLRIDTFRSGGSGGQSVNTTDSAVRITHIPTGVVVSCQNERSQIQNKEHAMAVLQGKLLTLMEAQQASELADLRGGVQEIAWGNQIRSYVLHPYKMVKDHRTNYEESNPDAVLNGEIDGFIEAELKKV